MGFAFVIAAAMALITLPSGAYGAHADFNQPGDGDRDGLVDADEARYGTDVAREDTDGDGYKDGDELSHGYDPLRGDGVRLPKRIVVDISEQRLRYFYGEFGEQGSVLVSSAARGYRTPIGQFTVQIKRPVVRYKGPGYDYPNTKWNLQFLPRYYIHGAWWHNNFGRPMSHGCVNVSYKDMEALYNFADEGTTVIIQK
ncbi:MAG: L,D-transpeptidase [bacterium]|nr:L,D-transpeptidase [bacterium]